MSGNDGSYCVIDSSGEKREKLSFFPHQFDCIILVYKVLACFVCEDQNSY